MSIASYCKAVVQVVRLSLNYRYRNVNCSLLKCLNNAKRLSNNVDKVPKCSEMRHKTLDHKTWKPCDARNVVFWQEGVHCKQNIVKHRTPSQSSEHRSESERWPGWNWTYSSLVALVLFSSKVEGEEEPKESELIIMIKRGILAIKKGELNKAEQLLHVALKSAQETQNVLAVTYIFDLLANIAYQREEYSKAENLFKEVLQRLLSGGMEPNDNAIVEISLKLASVYASMHDFEKAVQGFQFCIATQEEKIEKYGESNLDDDTQLLWGMSMDWYGRFLLNIHQYELAKKHFIKAFEMSERVNGIEHSQSAVLLNDIGSVCSLQKNYGEAINYLERAIDSARACKSIEIGSFYVNLGTVYMQQGVFAEAERCCKEGLSLSQKMSNEDAAQEAEICLNELRNIMKTKK